MPSQAVIVQILLGVAGLTQAQAPPGVFPQVPNSLLVQFGGNALQAGSSVPRQAVDSQPQIGLPGAQIGNNNDQRYTFLLVDLDDDGNGFFKREEAVANDAQQQPDDQAHINGRNTFLQALFTDLTASGQRLNNNAVMLQGGNTGIASYMAPQNLRRDHRYLGLVFEQAQGFNLNQDLQRMINQRNNFNMREFIQEANLPLPRWGTWFTVSNNGNGFGGGFGGGNGGGNGGGFGGVFTTMFPFTTVFTLPNGQPSTFTGASLGLTTSGGFGGGGGGFGNPTSGAFRSAFTTTYTTATTFPNGGPTATFLTTSVIFGGGGSNRGGNGFDNGLSTIFTTGFIGLSTTTTTSTTAFDTTTTFGNGQTSQFRTTSTTTQTLAVSGVSSVSASTFPTTSTFTTTGTTNINGRLTTFTSTGTSVQTTTSFTEFTGGVAPRPTAWGGGWEKAALGLAGAALVVL